MVVSRGSVQVGAGSLDSWAVAEVFETPESMIQDVDWGISRGLVTLLYDVWLLGLACVENDLSMVELELLLRQAVILWFLMLMLQVWIESQSLELSTNSWTDGTRKQADSRKKLQQNVAEGSVLHLLPNTVSICWSRLFALTPV